MLRIQHYVRPQTTAEAYELCQKKNHVILGGMLWLKMQNRLIHTAIDLQDLGLDQIEEEADQYRIGAMTSLRAMECHDGIQALTQGAMRECLHSIVGVQFRNMATIGGSIYGRFGFSDILTLCLAMDARVELYGAGVLSLSNFLKVPGRTRDLLLYILLPKQPRNTVYMSQRNISTDFPVLTCAVSRCDGKVQCAIGARPCPAVLIEDTENIFADEITEQNAELFASFVANRVAFGSNGRAGAEYRRKICQTLVRRSVMKLADGE